MRDGDELFDSRHKRNGSSGLRTERQISLFRKREAARRERAERREADARVRHLNFELVQRGVLLVLAMTIGIALMIGALGNPEAFKLAAGGATAWGVIAAALHRWRPKPRE